MRPGQATRCESRPYTGELKRITAKDPSTVVFELCRPDVAFLAKIAWPAFAINDSGWLRANIKASATGAQAIVTSVNGTGPYRLEDWRHGTEISLARNDRYWGATPANERLIVRWNADSAARVTELQNGTVDGIDALDPSAFATVTNDVSLALMPRPGMNIFYMGFNDTVAPFDNEKVRQAIAIGIDRQHIVDTDFPPGAELATSYAPCAIPHGCAGSAWYGYDPVLAKETLTAAGYPNGFDTTIQYPEDAQPYLPDPGRVAADIQSQLLANLGIRATLVPVSDSTVASGAFTGKLAGIHLFGQSATYPDVSAFLDPRFGGGASTEFGKPFADIGKALAAGDTTVDDAKRDASYATANNAIRTHVPMIPVARMGTAAAFRVDVDSTAASPLGLERFAAMTPGDRRQLVWLTTAEPPGLYCADETDPIADPRVRPDARWPVCLRPRSEVARDVMAGRQLDERRNLDRAALLGLEAASPEDAPARRVDRARQVALQHDPLPSSLALRIRDRHGRQQGVRVRVQRRRVDRPARRSP